MKVDREKRKKNKSLGQRRTMRKKASEIMIMPEGKMRIKEIEKE